MSRRLAALKPQLNRIRAWAYEGSTDAWIAHQLETTAEAVRAFRLEHGIERGGPAPLAPITPDSVVEAMLAEEEAAAAEAATRPNDPEPDAGTEPEPESAPSPRPRSRRRTVEPAAEGPEQAPVEDEAAEPAEEAPARTSSSRRRGARGGSGRGSAAATAASPEPQGEEQPESADTPEPSGDDEPSRTPRKRGRRRGRGRGGARGLEARLLPGSVLLLDPAVTADALFQEHWQDAGALRVEVSADAIVLRRVAEPEPERS